jgi:hypothetical protein
LRFALALLSPSARLHSFDRHLLACRHHLALVLVLVLALVLALLLLLVPVLVRCCFPRPQTALARAARPPPP